MSVQYRLLNLILDIKKLKKLTQIYRHCMSVKKTCFNNSAEAFHGDIGVVWFYLPPG